MNTEAEKYASENAQRREAAIAECKRQVSISKTLRSLRTFDDYAHGARLAELRVKAAFGLFVTMPEDDPLRGTAHDDAEAQHVARAAASLES
jgi:hypothetical protein